MWILVSHYRRSDDYHNSGCYSHTSNTDFLGGGSSATFYHPQTGGDSMTKITEADIFRSKLTPQDLARFLRLHAWKPIPLKHPGLIAFAGSPDQEGKNVEIILPTVGDESSVARNLASALNSLVALLDRPGAELIRLVQCVDRDIFGAKLADPQAQHGTISLERAVKVIGDLRDLFSYAACTEEDPRTAFAKATGIGAKHTKVCRFGHTL